MALQQLSSIFSEMSGDELRDIFLDVVRAIPDCRDSALEFLVQQRNDLSMRRTVSVDNLVDYNSGYSVSTPCKTKPRRLRTSVRCGGHNFVLHNYRKPSVCSFTNVALDGYVQQGYNCTNCMLDVHPKRVRSVPRCLGLKSMKARKMEKKRELKKTRRNPPPKSPKSPKAADARRKKLGSVMMSTSVVDREDEPTYIQPLPSGPQSEPAQSEAGSTDDSGAIVTSSQDGSADPEQPAEGSDDGGGFGSLAEENSSDGSEAEYQEANSSSEESGSEGEIEQVIERNHSSPTKKGRSPVDSDDESRPGEGDGGDEDGPRGRPRLRTGAKADWTRHGRSFRVRMNGTRKLTTGSVAIVLEDHKTLAEEFEAMPQNRVNIVTMPKLTEGFNRYMNILPNNHTRVVLSQIGDDETSTYINANWIDGYAGKSDEFIACQGPMESTIHAFWRMVWETEAGVIVMNTGINEKGVDKCARYWPDTPPGGAPATLTFEDFTIQASEPKSTVPEYLETALVVTRQGEPPRELTHLWWTGWPDKGVPRTANGIGDYVLRTRAAAEEASAGVNTGGPIVIHCSAGIGRTGCFLAINYCMQQYDKCGYVDILNCVCRLRQMRGMTVQTESQYRWIHTVMQRYMEGKLFEREDDGSPMSPAIDVLTDITELKVRNKKDRPLSFQLGRKQSTRTRRRIPERRSSVDEEDGGVSPERFPSPEDQPSEILVSGGSYPKGGCVFNVKTFVRPTTCALCESMLTGLALQGLRCSGCKRNICAVCLGTLKDSNKCAKKTNVRRQKSGLPMWPPQRPPSMYGRKKYGSRLDDLPEGST